MVGIIEGCDEGRMAWRLLTALEHREPVGYRSDQLTPILFVIDARSVIIGLSRRSSADERRAPQAGSPNWVGMFIMCVVDAAAGVRTSTV